MINKLKISLMDFIILGLHGDRDRTLQSSIYKTFVKTSLAITKTPNESSKIRLLCFWTKKNHKWEVDPPTKKMSLLSA